MKVKASRPRHSTRDTNVLGLWFAVTGSLAQVFALAFDLTGRTNAAWLRVLDLGLKTVVVVLLWHLFLRGGRAHRPGSLLTARHGDRCFPARWIRGHRRCAWPV